MKLLFVLMSMFTFTFANYVELYRVSGIDAVKDTFERVLQTKSYWDDTLKNKDVRYGYYESIDAVLLCTKSNKELTLYKKEKNKFAKSFSSEVLIGKKNGDKKKEGDLKTPVGVYKLTQRLTKVDPFYGPLALVTSYPNVYDKVKKKTGYGIWIHGLPKNQKRDNFTRGCVALDNGRLETLNSKFDYKKSILILSEKEQKLITKDDISKILSQIYQWKSAWENSELDKYISFYSKDFKNLNGLNLNKFKKRKARIFKRSKDKKIYIKNINISPYPSMKNESLFRIIMDEDYKAKYYKFKGKKELYVRLNSNGKISILTED